MRDHHRRGRSRLREADRGAARARRHSAALALRSDRGAAEQRLQPAGRQPERPPGAPRRQPGSGAARVGDPSSRHRAAPPLHRIGPRSGRAWSPATHAGTSTCSPIACPWTTGSIWPASPPNWIQISSVPRPASRARPRLRGTGVAPATAAARALRARRSSGALRRSPRRGHRHRYCRRMPRRGARRAGERRRAVPASWPAAER